MNRVALVCSGLGYVPRGFERYTRELFDAVHERAPVTLVAAVADGRDELAVRVPHLRRLGPGRAYRAEQALFALRALPQLRRADVVHYSEPYLGNVLAALRRRFALGYRLLLTDALGLSAHSASRADVLHVLTPAALEQARADGRGAGSIFSIPYGLRTGDFAGRDRDGARARLGLPAEARIVLDVAAVNRRHKRVDTLIDAAARLPDDWQLVLVGAPEEPELLAQGRARLGARFHHRRLGHAAMPDAYAAADVFAHAALEEGFGLGIVEAMAAGLPVVVNRSPHFEWLVGDPEQLVDARAAQAIAAAVERTGERAGERNRVRAAAFDWSRLAGDYVAMYESLLASPSAST